MLTRVAVVSRGRAQHPPHRRCTALTTAPIEVSAGIVAGVSIAVGLVLVFFGYRIFRVALGLGTVYFVYAIFYSLLVGVGVTESAVICWTSLAVGLVAGLIMMCFYKLGIFILGCVAGGSFAVWLLSWTDVPFITSIAWRWGFIIVIAIIFGILALLLIKVIAVISTAWVGSFVAFVGIDVFAQTGFAQSVSEILSGKTPESSQFSPACYGMLIGCVVLAVLGMLVQFKVTGTGDHHSHLGGGGKAQVTAPPADA